MGRGEKGDVGGFGNAFYFNLAADNLALTLNAEGNTVKGGINFIYLDDDNGWLTFGYEVKVTIKDNDYHEMTITISTVGIFIQKNPREPADEGFSFAVTQDALNVTPDNHEKGEDTTNPPVSPSSPSSNGNMNNSFRVLFDEQGYNFVRTETGLSYGDTIRKPADPV